MISPVDDYNSYIKNKNVAIKSPTMTATATTAKSNPVDDYNSFITGQNKPVATFVPLSSQNTQTTLSPAEDYKKFVTKPPEPAPAGTHVMPADLGGGVFNLPANGKLNLSTRGYAGEPQQAGGERDHIVPVSLGGVSTPQNIQFQPGEVNKSGDAGAKDQVEHQALADYKAGKISLAEARARVMQAQQQQKGLAPKPEDTVQPGGAGTFGKAVDTIYNSTKDFFDVGQKAIRAGSQLASTPIAYLLDKVTGGNLSYEDLAKTNVDIAKQTLDKTSGGQARDVVSEAAVNYLKNSGYTKTHQATPTDIGVLTMLGLSNLMGDPAFYVGELGGMKNVNQLFQDVGDLMKYQKVGERTIGPTAVVDASGNTIAELPKTPITSATKAIPTANGGKITLTPTEEGQVIVKGYKPRFGGKPAVQRVADPHQIGEEVQGVLTELKAPSVTPKPPAAIINAPETATVNPVEDYKNFVTKPSQAPTIVNTQPVIPPTQVAVVAPNVINAVELQKNAAVSPDSQPVADKITQLVQSPDFASNKVQKVTIAPAQPQATQVIKDNTGIDVSGYNHEVDNFALQHSLENHKNDPLPITKNDFALIPDIIKSPDAVEYVGKTKQMQDAIRYQKRFNGTTFYVEEVRTGRKTLNLKTMYKTKTPTSATRAPLESGPGTDRPPQTEAPTPDGVSNTNIAPATEKVNAVDTQASPIITDKTVEVPRAQLPVGEGETKVSTLEARIKNSLDNTSQDVIDKLGLSTYEQMSKRENIAAAVKYVEQNPEKALQVLQGEIEAPKGILRNSIFVAMQNLGKGDVNLARKLASIESTRFGQELSILTEIDPESPVSIMNEIVKLREGLAKTKLKGKTIKQARKEIVDQINQDISKFTPREKDWASFIEKIKCNY